MVKEPCIQLAGRRHPTGGLESPRCMSTYRNKQTRCYHFLSHRKSKHAQQKHPFMYVIKQQHKGKNVSTDDIKIFLEQKSFALELKTCLSYRKRDADFPTFVELGCLVLVLGERVVRLESTAATSQLLALLVKQFLVMWANKLVHT